MGLGLYNTELDLYEDAPWLTFGLWLEQDEDSELFDENCQFLWIIPNQTYGTAEIEGPDHVRYVQGPNAGQFVADVLNAICRKMVDSDPREWFTAEDWEKFGLVPISETVKRFHPKDGLYHA